MKDRDELLDELVGALARVRDEEIGSSGASKAGKALLEQITSMPYAEPGAAKARRGAAGGRRIRAVTLIAAAVFLVGGVAGAYGVFTEGRVVNEFDGPEVTPPEQLAQFDRFARGIPLPPGGSFDALKQSMREYPASMTERGFMDMVALNAACQWYGYWLAGYDAGDRRQMAEALRTIQEIPYWPKLDAERMGRRFARAAAAGDAEYIREWWTINCYSDPNYDPNDH